MLYHVAYRGESFYLSAPDRTRFRYIIGTYILTTEVPRAGNMVDILTEKCMIIL